MIITGYPDYQKLNTIAGDNFQCCCQYDFVLGCLSKYKLMVYSEALRHCLLLTSLRYSDCPSCLVPQAEDPMSEMLGMRTALGFRFFICVCVCMCVKEKERGLSYAWDPSLNMIFMYVSYNPSKCQSEGEVTGPAFSLLLCFDCDRHVRLGMGFSAGSVTLLRKAQVWSILDQSQLFSLCVCMSVLLQSDAQKQQCSSLLVLVPLFLFSTSVLTLLVCLLLFFFLKH